MDHPFYFGSSVESRFENSISKAKQQQQTEKEEAEKRILMKNLAWFQLLEYLNTVNAALIKEECDSGVLNLDMTEFHKRQRTKPWISKTSSQPVRWRRTCEVQRTMVGSNICTGENAYFDSNFFTGETFSHTKKWTPATIFSPEKPRTSTPANHGLRPHH